MKDTKGGFKMGQTTKLTDETKIEEVFQAQQYKKFRLFCKEKNLTSLTEINVELLEEFRSVDGVGEKKYTQIKDKLLSFNQLDLANIKLFFADSKYKMFREFCQSRNITRVTAIDQGVLLDFKAQKGVGPARYKAVKAKLATADITNFDYSSEEINLSAKKYELIKDLSFSYLLEIFEIEAEVDKILLVKEVINKNFAAINDLGLPIEKIKTLRYKLNQFIHPQNILSYLDFSKRVKRIIKLRYGAGYTLNKIGSELDLTKEGVRQLIAKKVLNKLSVGPTQKKIQTAFKLAFPKRENISYDELKAYFPNDKIFYIKLFEQCEILDKFEPLKLYFFTDISALEIKIKELFSSVAVYAKIEDYADELLALLAEFSIENLDLEELKKIIKDFGFKIYGDFLARKSLTIQEVVEIIFTNYLTDAFRVDEYGYQQLEKIAKKNLDYELNSSSIRAVIARIRDSEKIILVGKKKFIAREKLALDTKIIKELREFLLEIKESRKVINTREIFAEFKFELEANNITNKRTLYSVLKFHLGDEFKIGKKNTLNIYLDKKYFDYTREDRVIELLKENEALLSKDKIKSSLNWREEKLSDVVTKSEQLISWPGEVLLAAKLKLTEVDKKALDNLLAKIMKPGYVTNKSLFKQMKTESRLNSFLEKNNIDSASKLTPVIKYIYPRIKGHQTFLYHRDSNYSSIYDVIKDKFNGPTNKAAIEEFLEELGFDNQVTKQNIIEQLIAKEICIKDANEKLILSC